MYCQNCGKYIDDNAETCTGCGLRVKQAKRIKNPVIALILSFFIIGLGQIYNNQIKKGIILFLSALIIRGIVSSRPVFTIIIMIIWTYALYDSYNTAKGINIDLLYELKKAGIPGFRSGKKSNMIITILCIFLILAIIPYSPPDTSKKHSQSDAPLVAPIITPIPIQTTITAITTIHTPIAIQDDDKKFLEWTRDSMNALGYDVKDVSDAALSANFKLVESYSKTLKDDSKMYLGQIDEFSVSSNVKDIFDEYKSALEDFYLTGKYGEQGAKNMDTSDIKIATDYMNKAAEHLDRATKIAKSKTV